METLFNLLNSMTFEKKIFISIEPFYINFVVPKLSFIHHQSSINKTPLEVDS